MDNSTWDYSKGPPPIGGEIEIRVTPYKLWDGSRIVSSGDPDYGKVMADFDAVHEQEQRRRGEL